MCVCNFEKQEMLSKVWNRFETNIPFLNMDKNGKVEQTSFFNGLRWTMLSSDKGVWVQGRGMRKGTEKKCVYESQKRAKEDLEENKRKKQQQTE